MYSMNWINKQDMIDYLTRQTRRQFIIDMTEREAKAEEAQAVNENVKDYVEDPKQYIDPDNMKELEDYQNEETTMQKVYIDDAGLAADMSSTPIDPPNNTELVQKAQQSALESRTRYTAGVPEPDAEPDSIQESLIKIKNEKQKKDLMMRNKMNRDRLRRRNR